MQNKINSNCTYFKYLFKREIIKYILLLCYSLKLVQYLLFFRLRFLVTWSLYIQNELRLLGIEDKKLSVSVFRVSARYRIHISLTFFLNDITRKPLIECRLTSSITTRKIKYKMNKEITASNLSHVISVVIKPCL